MHLSFLKKKKKEWNCGNGIAEFHSTFHNSKSFFYPLISVISLPQLPKIYTLYFSNAIAANYFFSLPFSAMALPQLPKKIFSYHLVFLARTHTSSTHPGRRNRDNIIAKTKDFSLLLFIFLSPTFIEF